MENTPWPAQNLAATQRCMKHQCWLMLRLLNLIEQSLNYPAEGLGYEGSKRIAQEILALREALGALEHNIKEI